MDRRIEWTVACAAAACVVHYVARRLEACAARVPYAVRRRDRRFFGWIFNKKKSPLLDSNVLVAARRRYMCAAQSVSYANTNPLLLVVGRGARMFDAAGTAYLDTRNNVAHVGHSDVAVATAVANQVATLNTNTRYLHPNVCELARRLVETMPAGSELRETGIVFFVNSGSEANDLALRLCRCYTGRRGTVVVDRAYHGHTLAAIGLSPYKYLHSSFGGRGKPDEVEAARAPDTYRRGASAADAKGDMNAAIDALEERGHNLACFFVESGMSVAGVVVAPDGYLREAYAVVRARGGLCVADEIQTGLGRTGDWYAFQTHGAAPDLVTLGKPLGNGMPLAAVVCVGRVAEAFAKGPEYFNTFGGNPVCCAAGLAVLDVVERDRLRENAVEVGAYVADRLRRLRSLPGCPVHVGDVRGAGLFLGADLVVDLATKEPATKAASLICSNLVHKHHILTSLDGQHDNVLVIKPPLCFSRRDADLFLAALEAEMRHLASLGPGALANVAHTPT